jgi:pyruvate/2-oxoacid:ferredoxin oxidoreductase alpha subunit
MTAAPRYPGIRVTANGNELVSYHTETRIADARIFYPIRPSTELGGWIIPFGKDPQQTADQALILRRVAELSLTPGINCQDGFLTSKTEFLRGMN